MDGNADLRKDEGALTSYAGQWADLEGVTGCFTAAVFKYSCLCSETHDRPCHIVRHLAAFNEVLFSARMQLREIPGARGELALVSVADSGMHLPEPQDVQSKLGACLLHRLLKFHQCIAALNVTPFHFEKCASLLCDVLPYSRLKRLRLQFWCFPIRESICATIASLTSLEELECSFFRDCCAEFPTALAALVRTSPSLVVLGLQGTSMEQHATNNFLSCLMQSGILKELTLRGSLIPETCREELRKYLMFAPSLTSFIFTADSEKTETSVLEGILHNKTLSKVVITTFTGGIESIQLVAGIIGENTVISSLVILSIYEDVSPIHNAAYETWIEALEKNEALEELSIPYQIWNPQQWIRFHDVLSSKHHLKKVYVFSDSTNHNLLTHVCHTLEDSGVHDKVSCGVYFAEDNIDLLKCKMFSGLFLVGDVHEDVKTAALLQLPDCGHVTSLVLEIPRGNLAVSSALAEYVQSTAVLRKLEVSMGFADDFDFSDEWWRVIVESLARNNSLKELVFYVDSMSDRDVESIADAVNASRNIRKLTFGDSTVTSLRAFVSRLSLGITDNHTLLDIVLEGRLDQGWPEASKKVLAIYEVTRRNMGLMAVAAAFTKTTELDRYTSAALERICKLHGELLEDLAELADVSAAEIGGLARGHLKRTASLDEYMRITSVVKERVVCHPRDDGRMQLDDLNEDCWEMVRRYLMLDDVEEDVAHTECR
ncbi:hypothetical protein HPB52_008545 [Rhipicephalus sanguineus]|uniref:Uncharacterized protein n=1 Tax=Rhipicephalus sanguineus TaxID=34632 RepID=A0A9D4Q5R7_RHISA|nr:hypothetical protein HPB52_008545 [Rhipicephalus sanguineus]